MGRGRDVPADREEVRGAGTREIAGRPNLLRVSLCQRALEAGAEEAFVVEANIDDMNPQLFPPLSERSSEADSAELVMAALSSFE